MKKLTGVLVCLLLFTFISSARIIEVADAGITDKLKAVIAARNTPAGNSCPEATYMFNYDGDYPSHTNYACKNSGGATIDGNVVGATVSADYILIESTNQYVGFASDTTSFNSALGTLYFTVYFIDGDSSGTVNGNDLFEIIYNATNSIFIYNHESNGNILFSYEGGDTVDTATSTESQLALETEYRVGVSWRVDAGYDMAISVVEGEGTSPSWIQVDRDPPTMPMEGEPATITIGENTGFGYGVTDDYRIYNVRILPTWEATDPLD